MVCANVYVRVPVRCSFVPFFFVYIWRLMCRVWLLVTDGKGPPARRRGAGKVRSEAGDEMGLGGVGALESFSTLREALLESDSDFSSSSTSCNTALACCTTGGI